MNAFSSVPDITSDNIFYTVCVIFRVRGFSLTHILCFTQLVLSNRFLIFNSFFYYNCFGELSLKPLCMQRHSSSIQQFLFPISEPMLIGVNLPVIFSIFLLSWSKIPMSFIVHFSYLRVLFHCSSHGIKHIFGTFTSNSGDSKWITWWIFYFLWPVIVSLIRMTQGFLQLASIFIFFYIIEFVCETCQVLGFNHSIHMIRSICFLSIGIVIGDLRPIIKESWVDLLYPRLILSALTISTNMFRGAWDVNQVIVMLYCCLS